MKVFTPVSEVRLSQCRKNVFAFLALFLLIGLVYSNTLRGSWHFDDGPNITENRALHLRTLSWSEIRKASLSSPAASHVSFYRPVSRLSFALNHYFARDDVLGYHLVNLSVHLVAALFLYLFIYNTLNLPLLRPKYGPSSYFIALLATTFWALSPVQTQAVTYVVQRMASMAAMFYVMALYFYVKGKTARGMPAKVLLYLGCTLAGLLAIGSKENAVLLPLILLLYNLMIVRGASKEALKAHGHVFLLTWLVPLALGMAFLYFYTDVYGLIWGLYEDRVFTPWQRLLTEARVVVFYIGLLLCSDPSRLSIDHDIVISSSLLSPPTTILSVLLIVALVAAALLLARKRPVISFSVLFFLLNHMIESSILPLELIFEHRNYLPSMLFFVPVAVFLFRGISHFSNKGTMQGIVTLFVVFLVIASGHATYLRNFAWNNEQSLWFDCLKKYPRSFRAHHNLGAFFYRQGHGGLARSEYLKALECKELHSRKEKGITYFNLGLLLHMKGDFERAGRYYEKALAKDPCCPGAHTNLAGLLLMKNREEADLARAKEILEAGLACRNDKEMPIALSNLGILLMKMGRSDEALESLGRALDMAPGDPLTLLRLGYVHKQREEWGLASSYLKKFLRQNPGDLDAGLLLAEVYLRSGRGDLAGSMLCQVVRGLAPQELVSRLEKLSRDASVARTGPDLDILLPHLAEAYQKEITVMEGNRDYCLGRAGPPAGKQNKENR